MVALEIEIEAANKGTRATLQQSFYLLHVLRKLEYFHLAFGQKSNGNGRGCVNL